MATDLTKTFFDTFGIEPKLEEYDVILCTNPETKPIRARRWHKFYPQITDRILLELIRLGLNYDFVIHSKSVEELKEKLLALLIYNEAEFKQQVQALFEEG